MTSQCSLYFAQMTDLHVGDSGWNREQAKQNVRDALAEMEAMAAQPAIVLVTADLVNRGTRDELETYAETVAGTKLRLAAIPANHDLWGEHDTSAWTDLIGPVRQHVDCGDCRFVLLDAHRKREDGSWWANLDAEQEEWLRALIDEWSPGPVFVAIHPPALPSGDGWHDVWRGSNAECLFEALQADNVQALLTGHWHRNAEWHVRGVREINTGALTGWQWNATPPYYHFPTRPGYRWFHFDGVALRTFWREVQPNTQVTLTWAGSAHTSGPRPQVRPPIIGGVATLRAEAWSPTDPIASVEWSATARDWRPLKCTWQGLWSEWSGTLDPLEFRVGETALVVRATTATGRRAYDAVPARLEAGHPPAPVRSGQEMVFELFYLPE